MPLDSLKLPSITLQQQGRSPGSSPVVRLRSKEKEINYNRRYQLLEEDNNDKRTISLPRLFGQRGRSISLNKDNVNKYLHQSLSSVGGGDNMESDEDRSIDNNNFNKSISHEEKFSSTTSSKWPNFDQIVNTSGSQESLNQFSSSSIILNDELKPRSNSYGNNSKTKFTTMLESLNRKYKNKKKQQQDANPKSTVLFEESSEDTSGMRAWSNKNTYFTTAKSADSILQLIIDDFSETE